MDAEIENNIRELSDLYDEAVRREMSAVALYENLRAAALRYVAETAPLAGACSARVMEAREAVIAAAKGGAE